MAYYNSRGSPPRADSYRPQQAQSVGYGDPLDDYYLSASGNAMPEPHDMQYATQGYHNQTPDPAADMYYAPSHQGSHTHLMSPHAMAPMSGHGTPYSNGGHGTPYGNTPYSLDNEKYGASSYFSHQPTMHSPAGPGGFYSPYGQVRQQVLKNRNVQTVQLQEGNLVLDVPVPQSILTYAKAYGSHEDEFKKMRYTAVTCDPDDFIRQKYTLRPYLYKRHTELAIVITMYNESAKLFEDSMTSVIKNIQHLQSRTASKTWGRNSWEKVVVCIVADGRSKIDPRVLKMLSLQGVYQDGIAKDTVAGKDVTAHIFEYTSQVVVDHKGNVSGGIAPIQIIFILKEQNKKKLNSHRWFFNAACSLLNPNVTILIDAGTRPSGTSLYHLWKSFDKHANVGGACGEITVDLGRGCSNVLNPLVAAQNFEYKMSSILDKCTESCFGYISVLPGAFSAYRWKALQGAPLQAYFLGEKMHEPGFVGSASQSNMYLAEDRILCFEIVCKKKEAWVLRYVKSAKASTDAPNRVPEFISQRRRWLNGSLFAAVHATLHFYRIWTSGHNVFRCFWLQIEFIYNLVNLLFTFTALGNLYLAFYFLASSAVSDSAHDPFGGYGQSVLELSTNIWLALLFVILVCSLGNRPQGSKFAYIGSIIVFALLFCIALYCAGWTVWLNVPHTVAGWRDWRALLDNSAFRNIVISLAATYFLYIITSIVHLDPWHLGTCFIQYMLFMPSMTNILGIYSMCNLHDISWGTKGSTTVKDLGGASKKTGKDGKEEVQVELPTKAQDIDSLWVAAKKDLAVPEPEKKEKRDSATKQEDHFRNFRTNTLLAYLGTNLFLVLFFTSRFFLNWIRGELNLQSNLNPYCVVIFWLVAGLSAVRATGSITYMILRIFGH